MSPVGESRRASTIVGKSIKPTEGDKDLNVLLVLFFSFFLFLHRCIDERCSTYQKRRNVDKFLDKLSLVVRW